jgi:hypothetical protein
LLAKGYLFDRGLFGSGQVFAVTGFSRQGGGYRVAVISPFVLRAKGSPQGQEPVLLRQELCLCNLLATRHRKDLTDGDVQLLANVDLSIPGREAEVFWRYEENIRKEYGWVPEEVFRRERLKILRGFLDRLHIYSLHK